MSTDATAAPEDTREEVLAALQDRYAEGNRYVKTLDIRDDVEANATAIGQALAALEREGLLERYRETSTGVVWRMTEGISGDGGASTQ